jgi:hypothetical protein
MLNIQTIEIVIQDFFCIGKNIIKLFWFTYHLPIHCSIQAYHHQRIYK